MPRQKKTQEISIGKEKITFAKGTLKSQLGRPQDYTFKLDELEKLKKVENGKRFRYNKESRMMTPLLKRRITLAVNLMKMKK